MKRAPKPLSVDDLVQRIASFYAGKPVSVQFEGSDPNGTLGVTSAGGDFIRLGPTVRKALETLVANPRSEKAAYAGAGHPGLAVLIHEAVHNRFPDRHNFDTGEAYRDARTGFYGGDDEWQARQLGASLVPDAMQRFFGIPIDSPLGGAYQKAARGAGFTQDLGAPPPGTAYGNRSVWFNGGAPAPKF